MEINTEDIERMGQFYLGREYDLGKRELLEDLVLYDSKDLVTHGVVLGMTGSGKTGLCIAMLEEAAMDSIPAIVIDPKGDIANLLLTFPELRGEDFRPWINEDEARRKGVSPDEYADSQAAMWEKGIGEWGQTGERIRRFREKVDLTVYTPGSSAGVPVSILSSLDAPPFEVVDDAELFAERIESTVSSLLSLLGVDADPIQDPEHILLSNIFNHCWRNEEDVTLESLIGQIQEPPFAKVGVLDLDSFFPAKKRMELAMKMNNLLASPGFEVWLKGEPLDVQKMFYTEEGKPRISIFSIAHLGDAERMFFTALLLNQVLGWMRSQSGTTSLRAILYMDEIYGFLPPTANPPSKRPMLTMLKQARAFGLGVLLATQNPVDLDYKALSNIGTWFLGRLQTERDKMRVLDGLEGAAASQDSGFDRKRMEETLAGLGSRVFLMNNVHEEEPVTFHVRWVMSYLRGPMTRRQIKTLMEGRRGAGQGSVEAAKERTGEPAGAEVAAKVETGANASAPGKPELPAGVEEWFLPAPALLPDAELVYVPAVLRSASVKFSKASLDVFGERRVAHFCKVGPGDPVGEIDWMHGRELAAHPKPVSAQPHAKAVFEELPADALEAGSYAAMKRDFVDWIYQTYRLKIFRSPLFGEHSKAGESEGEFRARLAQSARERRDELKEKLRERHEKEIVKVESQLRRAEESLDREKSDVSAASAKTAMSIGSTLFGAIMGRKLSRRTSTVISSARTRSRQKAQARRATEKVAAIVAKLDAMEAELREKMTEVEEKYDPMSESFEVVEIKPFKKNIRVEGVGILWLPHVRDGDGGLRAT